MTRDSDGIRSPPARSFPFFDARSGFFKKHPKTGKSLSKEIKEAFPLERILTIEEIVAIVKKAGYPTLYGVSHENTLYEVHAHNKSGRMVFLYVDPKTGEILPHP